LQRGGHPTLSRGVVGRETGGNRFRAGRFHILPHTTHVREHFLAGKKCRLLTRITHQMNAQIAFKKLRILRSRN